MYLKRFARCRSVKTVTQFYQPLSTHSLKTHHRYFALNCQQGNSRTERQPTQIMHSVFIAVHRSAEFITYI